MTPFVILAAPRTGSNLLCTLLNSHPEILCHHEVFNPNGIFTALTHRQDADPLGSLEERDRDPLGFLQRVWQTGCGQRCVGFKWTRGQNETVYDNVVADPQIKKILLQRTNRLKTFVSEQIARQTQQWEVYHEPDLVWPRPRIAIDPEELKHHVSLNTQFYHTLRTTLNRSAQPYATVVYESLFDPDEQRRMLEFLGIQDVERPLTAGSVKQNPTDLQDLIANFAELEAHFAGSEFEAELHDRGM